MLRTRTALPAIATLLVAVTAPQLATGPVSAAPPAHAGIKLEAVLLGVNEHPALGDPDGRGLATVTINPGHGTICYTLTVSDIAPASAAHIHAAPAGSAGPVVQGLTPPTAGSSSDCLENRSLARRIKADPSAYYVNVHNTAFPGGALRGQLAKR